MLFEISVDQIGVGDVSAIDQHSLAVAQHQCGIRLAHVNEMNCKALRRPGVPTGTHGCKASAQAGQDGAAFRAGQGFIAVEISSGLSGQDPEAVHPTHSILILAGQRSVVRHDCGGNAGGVKVIPWGIGEHVVGQYGHFVPGDRSVQTLLAVLNTGQSDGIFGAAAEKMKMFRGNIVGRSPIAARRSRSRMLGGFLFQQPHSHSQELCPGELSAGVKRAVSDAVDQPGFLHFADSAVGPVGTWDIPEGCGRSWSQQCQGGSQGYNEAQRPTNRSSHRRCSGTTAKNTRSSLPQLIRLWRCPMGQ